MDEHPQDRTRTSQPKPILAGLSSSPRFADSFGLVLLLLVASFFVVAAVGDTHAGSMVALVVFGATTWLALRASQVQRRVLRAAEAAIPIAVVVALVMMAVGTDSSARIVSAVCTGVLIVVAPVAILRRLLAHPTISLNTFYGAVCVYLLIAMFFATAYGLIAALTGAPFFVQLQDPAQPPTQIDYLYFSFITMTTVGYGDLTAAGAVGRMTAALEAILGQLYLITVVALVVQNLGQKRVESRVEALRDKREDERLPGDEER